MKIELIGDIWIINDGEYTISEWEYFNNHISNQKYVIRDSEGEEVYCNDDFEKCIVWIYNSI